MAARYRLFLAAWGEHSVQDQLMSSVGNSNKPLNVITRELQHFTQQFTNTVTKNALSSCCLEVKRRICNLLANFLG